MDLHFNNPGFSYNRYEMKCSTENIVSSIILTFEKELMDVSGIVQPVLLTILGFCIFSTIVLALKKRKKRVINIKMEKNRNYSTKSYATQSSHLSNISEILEDIPQELIKNFADIKTEEIIGSGNFAEVSKGYLKLDSYAR